MPALLPVACRPTLGANVRKDCALNLPLAWGNKVWSDVSSWVPLLPTGDTAKIPRSSCQPTLKPAFSTCSAMASTCRVGRSERSACATPRSVRA